MQNCQELPWPVVPCANVRLRNATNRTTNPGIVSFKTPFQNRIQRQAACETLPVGCTPVRVVGSKGRSAVVVRSAAVIRHPSSPDKLGCGQCQLIRAQQAEREGTN